MKTLWGIVKRHKLLTSGLITLAVIGSMIGVQVTPVNPDSITIGQQHVIITIGDATYASGTVDYTCDGVDDNIQFQGAIDSLPNGAGGIGGEIQVLTGNYVFSATVTRAIANVTIRGVGRASYFAHDAATPIFTAGGNNWSISNLRVDTTTAVSVTAMGATTLWSWENVTTSDGYYAYRTDDLTTGTAWNIPTGRTATYVIAASDAPAHVKAQADYVCDGTADNVEIQAAIDAVYASANGWGSIVLTEGTFNWAAQVKIKASHFNSMKLSGQGISVTYNVLANGVNADMLVWEPTLGWDIENFALSDMSFSGNSANQASGNILNLSHLPKSRISNIELADAKQSCLIATSTNDIHLTNVTASGSTASEVVKFVNCNGIDSKGLYIYKYSGADGTGLNISAGSESSFVNTVIDGSNADVAMTLSNASKISFSGFYFGAFKALGLYVTGSSQYNTFQNGKFNGRGTLSGTGLCIFDIDTSSYNIYSGLHFDTDIGGGFTFAGATPMSNLISDCDFSMVDTVAKRVTKTTGIQTFSNNIGYIDSGEIRTASGSLTAGNANAIFFAWHDPEFQDIFIKKVVIEITTPGGTALSVGQVGIADDAAGTNIGTEFFTAIVLNTAQVNDSYVAGDTGAQTKWILVQDSASATDGWVVGKITVQNAASLVGSYYIEYVGK